MGLCKLGTGGGSWKQNETGQNVLYGVKWVAINSGWARKAAQITFHATVVEKRNVSSENAPKNITLPRCCSDQRKREGAVTRRGEKVGAAEASLVEIPWMSNLNRHK